MRVAGRTTVAAPAPALLSVLREPERLVEALPNVEGFRWADEPNGCFAATIRPSLGLGEIPVESTWQRVRAEEDVVRYSIDGRTGEHWIGLDAELVVREGGEGAEVEWAIDYRLTGTMRSAGQRTAAAIIAAQLGLVLEAAADQARRQA